jgi:hypothetical protein
MLCPGNEGGCCAGYVWSCVDGAWQKSGVGCACMEDAGSETHDATGDVASDAGPFACGSATCDANQICKVQAPGIDGGTESRACEGVPSACASTPTCDCIKTKLPGCTANACTTDAQGHVTVSCMGI